MKLEKISIQNFRGYKDKITLDLSNFTALVGKNDIGKSTIMDALDIFFNNGKGIIKIDKTDINVVNSRNGINDVVISAFFSDLPTSVVLDGSYATNLKDEYLLNEDGFLEVVKTFKNGDSKAASIKVQLNAFHPTCSECDSLLQKKNADLKKIVERLNLSCDKTVNAEMRAAIWGYYKDNLACVEKLIDVSAKDGDIKNIWEKLQIYLPHFSLFQSDRKNSDSDDEVQDPLKEAVRLIFADETIQRTLSEVATKVKEKVQEVADLTLEKLHEMAPEVSNSLHPNIPSVESLKWADVFKGLSISGDQDISINKRGSGIKRLVLLNFFRAEAERRKAESHNPSIIYAIEEPETSQHKNYQIMLVNALKQLANEPKTQVIITTHSSDIVKNLNFTNLKMVCRNANDDLEIKSFAANCLPYPSLNEANYNAFGDASEEFHNELYGYLQAKATDENAANGREGPFDGWLESKGCLKNKSWIRIRDGVAQPAYMITLQTYVRNCIHHPENTINPKYTKAELEESIVKMVEVVKNLT